MAFYYSSDPVRDAERYAADQDRRIAQLPVCSYCGEPVQDMHYYQINDEVICPQCLEDNYRKNTEDYIA